jgi:D-xylose transport system substrate-binding protein
VDNANGSATTQQAQAQALINAGVGVLLVVNLDPGSGKAIESLAKQHNVVTIDYDRLTAGGSASYYVSYNNVQVGIDQGTALTQCPQVKGKSSVNYVEIDGAPTDNNATLFAEGYNSVLSKQPGWHKLADQTGNWDAATAQQVFTTMLGQHPNINAVMVANDTMAQSVINVLKSQNLAGKVAVSGQDATAGGLDNIMAGAPSASPSTSRSPVKPTWRSSSPARSWPARSRPRPRPPRTLPTAARCRRSWPPRWSSPRPTWPGR